MMTNFYLSSQAEKKRGIKEEEEKDGKEKDKKEKNREKDEEERLRMRCHMTHETHAWC